MDVGNVCSLLASCRTLLFPQRLLLGHFLSGQRPHDFVWGKIGKKSFICLRGGDVPEGWAEEEALAGAEKAGSPISNVATVAGGGWEQVCVGGDCRWVLSTPG